MPYGATYGTDYEGDSPTFFDIVFDLFSVPEAIAGTGALALGASAALSIVNPLAGIGVLGLTGRGRLSSGVAREVYHAHVDGTITITQLADGSTDILVTPDGSATWQS
jgi:hypothetical protein